MEVVGVVLGIVPLFISAAEHWDDLRKVVKRYRHHEEGFDEMHRALKSEVSMFRSEVKLLLDRVVGPSKSSLLRSRSKTSSILLHEQSVNVPVMTYLGSNGDSCLETLQAIEQCLKRMRERENAFRGAREQTLARDRKETFTFEVKARKSVRLRWAFAESGLEKQMDELTRLNQVFRDLINQAERGAEMKAKFEAAAKTDRKPKCNVDTNAAIQKMSKLLYEKLAAACTKHSIHRAYFSLQPWIKQQSALNLRFRLSYFSNLSPAPSMMQWFSVESVLLASLGTSRPPSTLPHGSGYLTYSNTHGTLPLGGIPMQPPTTSSRRGPVANEKNEADVNDDSRSKVRPAVDSCRSDTVFCGGSSDLCSYLRKRTGKQDCRECLGFLENSSECQLMMYAEARQTVDSPQASVKLSDVLSKLEGGRAAELAPHERLRFALLLATAVLQFHSTPWMLDGVWRSHHLCIPVVNLEHPAASASTAMTKLDVPHMDVLIKTGSEAVVVAIPDIIPVANNVLFSLGLVLIELAYQEPFDHLCTYRTQPPVPNYSPRDREYIAAFKLVNGIFAKLGQQYQDVVQKCLFFDFGDLGQGRSEEKFCSEVIDVLDGLQQEFQRLYLF